MLKRTGKQSLQEHATVYVCVCVYKDITLIAVVSEVSLVEQYSRQCALCFSCHSESTVLHLRLGGAYTL